MSILIPDSKKEAFGYVQAALQSPYGQAVWDVITALRGPDSPSERDDNTSDPNYKLRVERKMNTVAVIRGVSNLRGGSCRSRNDRQYVILPPHKQWDHFDKHVARAAAVLGIEVKTEGEKK